MAGISWNKATKKWVCYININGIKKSLGSFEKQVDARKARLKTLKKIK